MQCIQLLSLHLPATQCNAKQKTGNDWLPPFPMNNSWRQRLHPRRFTTLKLPGRSCVNSGVQIWTWSLCNYWWACWSSSWLCSTWTTLYTTSFVVKRALCNKSGVDQLCTSVACNDALGQEPLGGNQFNGNPLAIDYSDCEGISTSKSRLACDRLKVWVDHRFNTAARLLDGWNNLKCRYEVNLNRDAEQFIEPSGWLAPPNPEKRGFYIETTTTSQKVWSQDCRFLCLLFDLQRPNTFNFIDLSLSADSLTLTYCGGGTIFSGRAFIPRYALWRGYHYLFGSCLHPQIRFD